MSRKQTAAKQRPATVAPQRYEDAQVDQLRPHPSNPNQGDVGAIVESIRENGFFGVVVAQRDTGHILAGEHRWRAARQLGLSRVPVMFVDCDADQALRIMLADNRTAELGMRDPIALHELLDGLMADGGGLAGTGYDGDYLDELRADIDRQMADVLDSAQPEPPIDGAGEDEPDDEDDGDATIPDADRLQGEWQTARGQVWRIDGAGLTHHAACIDSFSADERAALLALSPIAPTLGLHDPPYGIGATKGGKAWANYSKGWKGGNFDVAQKHYAPVIWDGEAFDPAPLRGLTKVEVWWGVNWFMDKLPPSSCIIAWDKRVDLPSNSYSDFELAWVNVDKPARLIRHRWFGCVKDSERGEGRLHPTQKPVVVQAQLIELFSQPGDVVLDLFGGAGSTLLAAHDTGRSALVAELSPAYLATILERAKQRGLTTTLIATLPAPEAPPTPATTAPATTPAPTPKRPRRTKDKT